MKDRKVFLYVSCLLFLALLVGCSSTKESLPPTETPPAAATATPTPQPTATPTQLPLNLLDALALADDLSIFHIALSDTGLSERLRSEGPYTLFAPTNDAFGELPDAMMNDQEALFQVMLYLIVDQHVTEQALTQDSTLSPMLGNEAPLTISSSNGLIRVNDAAIVGAPISAQNGLIYTLDKVLVPPTITLLALQEKAPLANAVLPNLLQLAEAEGNLSTFLDGLRAAGLIGMLEQEGAYTLFVPTDRAFEQLVEVAPGQLLKLLDEDPAPFLKYHIVPGYLAARSIQDGLNLQTLAQAPIRFTAQGVGEGLKVLVGEGSDVAMAMIQRELPARNGVIHLIDAVLLPPNLQP